MPNCECRCGGTTKGGKFIPGHDMKLKGALKRAYAAGDTAAYEELSRRGWLPGAPKPKMTKAEKDAERQRKADEKAAAQKAAEEAQAIATIGPLDAITGMKAAADVLRQQGRYRRSDPGYIEVTRRNYNDILNGLL